MANDLMNYALSYMPKNRDGSNLTVESAMGMPKDPGPYQIDQNAGNLRGYEGTRQVIDDRLWHAENRAAPTGQAAQLGPAAMSEAARLDHAKQAQGRAAQMSLAQALQAQTRGGGPSMAGVQMRQGGDRTLAQAMAAQANQGGAGAMSAMRGIGAERSAMGNQIAADTSAMRLAEQMQARNQLGQTLAQGRGGDIGMAQADAGMAQQSALANMQAKNQFALTQSGMNQQMGAVNLQAAMRQQEINDQLSLKYRQMGMSLDQAAMAAKMEMQELLVRQQGGADRLWQFEQDRAQDNTNRWMQTAGTVLGAGGQMIGTGGTGGDKAYDFGSVKGKGPTYDI